MQTIAVYDNTGHILYQGAPVYEPSGVPFMYLDVPQGKTVASIDTSVTPHVPVYADTNTKNLQDRVTVLEEKIAEFERLCFTTLEGAADTYETVLPFLP